MKQIVIDTGNTTGLAAFGLFAKEGLKAGDTVRILKRPKLSQEAWVALVLLVMVAANYFLKRKPANNVVLGADDLITELAKSDKGVAALQQELKADHDVNVETDPPVDPEYDSWREFALQTLNRGYADNEPDISHITLLEPNPDYRPWKPDK